MKTIKEVLNYHKLNKNDEIFAKVLQDPSIVGFDKNFYSSKSKEHRRDLIIGEYFIMLSEELGKIGSNILMSGQWSYETPDWFDHRHHFLDWENQSKNNWAESVSLVTKLLPINGTVLNICAGDTFFDCKFLKQISSQITCVDIDNANEYKNYLIKKHSAPNIEYVYNDIMMFEPKENFYDVVWMRSAIEHFNEENQIKLFNKIKKSLKTGGWYCGDTPANPEKYLNKEHSAHENEWLDIKEAENTLKAVFDEVHVYSLHCNKDNRTTIFWCCR